MVVLQTRIQEEEDIAVLDKDQHPYNLVVWNDDVNTFDWVIESLIEICRHTRKQAEQCALFIHFNGKYGVKEGSYSQLNPMRTALLDRGITATIEETADV